MATAQSILSRGNNRLARLIEAEIQKQNLIKTGDLLKSIDAQFVLKNKKITIKIGAMYYYTFLDNGTRHIKSRNITQKVINSDKFVKLMEDVAGEYIEFLIDIN
tara:strand:- start:231 stop:542 length:312 start_codon:yes stop_codon:yes gene_type:complete